MELLDIQEVGTAPTTALAPADRAALALESSKTEQHLLALATKHASITVVKDKAGREQAHGAYIEVMRARTSVEKAGKEARDDATKFSKAVIAEEKRLVAIIEPEEARLKAARDVWDEEQARIKAEAEAKERARVLAITERIAAIKSYVVLANNCRTSERVFDLRNKLSCVDLEGFEEFEVEASNAYREASEHLEAVFNDRQAQEVEAARIKAEQEAEAARLKAEREELARQQAEAAAAIKKQQDELAAQREAAAAEAQRVADEARAQAEAAEARVRAAAEEMAAQRAELERMRAELEAKAKPAEEPFVLVVEPEPTMFEQVSAPAQPTPGVTLIQGEFGVLDAGVHIVPSKPAAPVASAIVLAVAEFWLTDTKTAARWITERAAEIETLKG